VEVCQSPTLPVASHSPGVRSIFICWKRVRSRLARLAVKVDWYASATVAIGRYEPLTLTCTPESCSALNITLPNNRSNLYPPVTSVQFSPSDDVSTAMGAVGAHTCLLGSET